MDGDPRAAFAVLAARNNLITPSIHCVGSHEASTVKTAEPTKLSRR
jgi:hypothetical protein